MTATTALEIVFGSMTPEEILSNAEAADRTPQDYVRSAIYATPGFNRDNRDEAYFEICAELGVAR